MTVLVVLLAVCAAGFCVLVGLAIGAAIYSPSRRELEILAAFPEYADEAGR